MLLTREEIEEALKKVLPNLPSQDIQKAAKALIELEGKWQEIDVTEIGAALSVQCPDICPLGEAYAKGKRIRAFVAK